MIMASVASLFLESALHAFNILLSVGAGTGLLFILRWFWSRINAYSEIAAMVVSFLAAGYFQSAELPGWAEWHKLVGPIAITTLAWVLEGAGQLTTQHRSDLSLSILCVIVGSVGIYSLLFSIGYSLYGQWLPAVLLLVLALACAGFIKHSWRRL